MVRPLTTQAVAPVKPPFGPASGTTTVGQQPLAKKPSGSNVFGIFAKKPAAVPGAPAPVSNPPAVVAPTTLGSAPSAQPVPQKERPVDVIPSAKPVFDTVGSAPAVTVARAAVIQPTTPVVVTATTNFPRPEPTKAESPAVAIVKPAAPVVMSPVAAVPLRTVTLDMKEQLRQPLESSFIAPADEYEYEIDDRYVISFSFYY